MTRRDILQCAHEPFGDAFYYGPERLSERFADDEEARVQSGFSKSTYKTIMDRLERDGSEVRFDPLSIRLCSRNPPRSRTGRSSRCFRFELRQDLV